MKRENPEFEDISMDRTEAFNNLGAAVADFISLGMRQLKADMRTGAPESPLYPQHRT